jgi:hypothetical protein
MIDLEAPPLWLIFLVSVILIFAASDIGRFIRRRFDMQEGGNAETLEGAMLGLLALLVGFTFAIALSHFDERRNALLTEANAIHATALRARLLPAPHGSECVRLLDTWRQCGLRAMLRI